MTTTANKIEFHDSPEYTALAPKLTGFKTLYDGDHDKVIDPQYLWLHEFEADQSGTGAGGAGAKLRKIREQRSRYLNLIEPIVSRWISSLFRGEFAVPPSVEAMLGKDTGMLNIDGKGASFESFVKNKVALNHVLYGRPVVLVDTPGVAAGTVAEAKAKGLRPYATVLDPLQVRDWSYSSDPKLIGKLQVLRVEYEREVPRRRATEKPTTESVCVEYYLDAAGKYHQAKYVATKGDNGAKEWKPAGDIPFPFDELPISMIESDSFVKDAVEMALLAFNFMSAESSCLNAQAFQRIFVSGEDDEKRKVFLNEYVINFLASDAAITTVEPSSTASLENAIMRAIDWTFKVAFNQVEGLSAMSKESPSAETRREMKDDYIALVESTLTELEDLVNNMLRHWALITDTKPPQRMVFDKSVSDDDFEREIAIWQAHADKFSKLPTLTKAMLKKHAKALNVGDDEAIEKEIDGMTIEVEPEANPEDGEADADSRTKKLRQGADGDTGAAADQ